jgi:hypothetical protein
MVAASCGATYDSRSVKASACKVARQVSCIYRPFVTAGSDFRHRCEGKQGRKTATSRLSPAEFAQTAAPWNLGQSDLTVRSAATAAHLALPCDAWSQWSPLPGRLALEWLPTRGPGAPGARSRRPAVPAHLHQQRVLSSRYHRQQLRTCHSNKNSIFSRSTETLTEGAEE